MGMVWAQMDIVGLNRVSIMSITVLVNLPMADRKDADRLLLA